MFFHILKKDLKRKRTMNAILFMFIILAATFLASSANNLIAVTGAVDHFIGISKVPDYFAIHVLEQEEDVIETYLKKDENTTEYEVIDTFNITNDRISIVEAAEAESGKYERTNVLCVQAVSDNFMKTFDQEGNPIQLQSGEIAFPRVEAEKNGLQVGDKVSITVGEVEQEFTITTLTKDAVFGSSMMGFKRLLIAQEDFDAFAAQENLLYTKIYCVDCVDRESFQKDFKQQNFNLISSVEKDTIPMCYIFDMLIAGILMIFSVCLILIAVLVLRFTIMFTLQEDYREIGIMKAIGMQNAGIKGIYLVKYFAIAVLGAAVGFVLSFPFGGMLLKQAVVNIVVPEAEQNYLINALCAMGIVAIVLIFCNSSANKLKKFSAIDAIRNGSNGERYQTKNRLKLWKRWKMSPGLYMACNDILSSPRRFAVLGITFCIGTLLILLPLSAVHTLKSDGIISLFGLSPSDTFIDTGTADKYVAEKNKELLCSDLNEIEKTLREKGLDASTGAVLGYNIPVYTDDSRELYSYYIFQETGTLEGNFTLLAGKNATLKNELVLTEITAEEMGVVIGDSVYFQYPDRTEEYIVTGTYQSMMNMGYGIRVSRAAELDDNYFSGLVCMQAEVADMESGEACQRIGEIFPDYRVMMADGFLDSMIGGITGQLDMLMYLILGVVLAINCLITVLTMKTMLARERGDIALLRSIGFQKHSIRMWQIERILLILIAAIFAGTVLSKVLAPVTIEPIFSMMGASSIELTVNPLETYVLYPLLLLMVTGFSACLCSREVGKVDLREINNAE